MDSIFGSSPSTQTTTTPTLSPQQSSLLNQLLAQFSSDVTSGKQPTSATDYTGPFAAPLSNLQNLSLTALEQMSQSMANPTTYQAANAAIDNQLATGGKQSITDTFQNSVVNPYLKQFQTQIMPKVLGNFSGQSAFGSDKAAQENIALGNLNDSILSAGSSLSLQAGNQANSNILSALGLVPSVTGAPINNAVATLNAGAVPTNESNIGIGNAITASANNNAANANNIKAILASLGIQTTQSTTTVNPGQAGILGNVIGAAGSFAGSQAGSAAIANFFA